MKKISDLAQNFQKTSQQEAKNIEAAVKAASEQLTQSINAELKRSEQKIYADIREKT